MVTSERKIRLVSSGAESKPTGTAGGRGSAVIIVLIAVLLVAATWVTAKSDNAAVAPTVQGPQDGGAAAAFEYFPAQYTNQATTIEEHIQAF